MIYRYIMYDYIIKANRPCKYLREISNSKFYNIQNIIEIKIHNNDVKTNDNDVKTNDDVFRYKYTESGMIGIWKGIHYYMNFEEHNIEVYCGEDDDAYLFILNIPLSILLAYDDKLIFHSSNLLINGNLYSFSGPKGVGKSTITAILSQKSDVILFSDDTICIDVNNSSVYSNYYVTKYTKHTLDILKLTNCFTNNCLDYKNNKYINKILYTGGAYDISRLQICYLFRDNIFYNIIVTNKFAQIDLFLRNIVGIKYCNKKMREKIVNNVYNLFGRCDYKSQIINMPNIGNFNKELIKNKLLNILV